MKNIHRGFIIPLLLVIIALLLAGGGTYLYTQKKSANPPVFGNVPTTTLTTQTSELVQPLIVDPKTLKVGDVVGKWTVSSINDRLSFYPDGSPAAGTINFTGSAVVTGTIGRDDMTGGLVFTPVEQSGVQIPVFKIFDLSNTFRLFDNTQKITSTTGKITIEIKDFGVSFEGKEGSGPYAEFVRIVQTTSTTPTADWRTYKNDTYGFTLQYPQTWEQSLKITSEPIRFSGGTQGEALIFSYNSDPLFSVSIYTKSQWALRLKDDYPNPVYLSENASHVFAYTVTQNGVYRAPESILKDVEAVIATFRLQ